MKMSKEEKKVEVVDEGEDVHSTSVVVEEEQNQENETEEVGEGPLVTNVTFASLVITFFVFYFCYFIFLKGVKSGLS